MEFSVICTYWNYLQIEKFISKTSAPVILPTEGKMFENLHSQHYEYSFQESNLLQVIDKIMNKTMTIYTFHMTLIVIFFKIKVFKICGLAILEKTHLVHLIYYVAKAIVCSLMNLCMTFVFNGTRLEKIISCCVSIIIIVVSQISFWLRL